MKINFKDVTFAIPLRIDSSDRLFNLKHNVNYIQNNFETNIIIFESDSVSNEAEIKSMFPDIEYMFTSSNDGSFHRTRYLNQMYRVAKTNIIVNYDVDVFLPVEQITLARDVIILGGYDCCIPYEGRAHDVTHADLNKLIVDNKAIAEWDGPIMYQHKSVGGAIFFVNEKYKSVGWENENFTSWGYEDNERVHRMERLGCSVTKIEGPLYHIHHQRSADSTPANPLIEKNRSEYEKIIKMTDDELRAYVASWPWISDN